MRAKRLITGELLGMTSKNEQKYFERYGAELYLGKGEVVDLGCWLGSTTISLAKGLTQNSHFKSSKRKIQAFDVFVWYDVMEAAVAGTKLVGKYKDGDSFLAEYKNRVGKYEDIIEIHEGDLKEARWNGKEIEFLLVDAMKNWELTNAIIKNFYQSLILNESRVLHQDFAHYFTPWIHLTQWYFREYFVFEEDIPNSSSVVYKYVKKIPAEKIKQTFSFENFSDEDIKEAFDYSLNLVLEEKKANIYAAKVMTYIHQKRFGIAKNCFDEILANGIEIKNDLLIVKELIEMEEA